MREPDQRRYGANRTAGTRGGGCCSGVCQGKRCRPAVWQGSYAIGKGFNHRVQQFLADGTFVSAFGDYGSGDGQFDYPQAIAIDADGNLFVADANNHRIQKFAPA